MERKNANKSDPFRSLSMAAALIGVGVVAALWMFQPVTATREAARPTQCRNNLFQLGLALHNFHDAAGSFPPAIGVDDAGHPIHSWRTLILPFIDHAPLYNQYHKDEPWNGPHNQTLHERLSASVCECPSDPEVYHLIAGTNYAAVVGPDTAWPADGAIRLADITDGPANTILLVEVSPALDNWFEPRDLDFDAMSFRINDPDQPSLSSHHKTKPSWPWQEAVPYMHVLMADGAVRRLPASTPPETLRALLTIAGGESLNVQWLGE